MLFIMSLGWLPDEFGAGKVFPGLTEIKLTGTLGQRVGAIVVLLLVALPFSSLGLAMILLNPESGNKLLGILWGSIGLLGWVTVWWWSTPRRLQIGDEGIKYYVGGRLRKHIPWNEVALVRLGSAWAPPTVQVFPAPGIWVYRLSIFSRRSDGKLKRRWIWDFRPTDKKLARIREAMRFYQRQYGIMVQEAL